MMFNQRPKVLPTYVSRSEFAELLKAKKKAKVSGTDKTERLKE